MIKIMTNILFTHEKINPLNPKLSKPSKPSKPSKLLSPTNTSATL